MAGFFTRDNQGRVTFQLTDRIVRLLGAVQIGSGSTAGAVDIPAGMSGTPFYFCCFSEQVGGESNNGKRAELAGRHLSWSGMPVGTVIRFGVY